MKQKQIFQGAEAKIFLDKKNNLIIKDRIKKSYRIQEIDERIRKLRTRSEEKLLIKASKVINCPIPLNNFQENNTTRNFLLTTNYKSANKVNNKLIMPFIDGKKLSECLDKFPLIKQKQILKQIGQDVAKLHDAQIIHGDLTTSNMIYTQYTNEGDEKSSASQINENITNNKLSQYKINTLTKYHQKALTKSGFEQYQSASDSEHIFFIDFGLGFISQKFEDKAVDIHLLKQALEAKHFTHWKILFKEFLKGYKKSKDFEKTLTQLKKVEKRGRYRN